MRQLMNAQLSVSGTVEAVRLLLRQADDWLGEDYNRHPEDDRDNTASIQEAMETCFLQLLALTEGLKMPHLHSIIAETFTAARLYPRKGLAASEQFEDYDPWLKWSGPVNQFIDTLTAVYGLRNPSMNVRIDLITLLKACQNAVTDPRCFSPPRDEGEVHNRIEMVLRCSYPDLLHKPRLHKTIKSFEPDTGLPSIGTLVEYKFLNDDALAGKIADEILADTRGYESSDWQNIVFVIYETRRFRAHEAWRQLLSDCGVPRGIDVVLLHGEQPESDDAGRSRPARRGAKVGVTGGQPTGGGTAALPSSQSQPEPAQTKAGTRPDEPLSVQTDPVQEEKLSTPEQSPRGG